MSDRLTIEIFGMLNGAAEGPLAIVALVLVALVLTKRLWWPRAQRPSPRAGAGRAQGVD